MVQLDVVRSCNSTLVTTQPIVAVFVGGTSGIGQFTAQALAATHSKQGKGLRLYIVGRNASAAEKTVTECKTVCPEGDFRFVQAKDLALMNDVDSVCDEIIRVEEGIKARGEGVARIDFLVLSQHYFPLIFEPRADTKEGLDTSISLLYYSRMRFIIKLLPLLLQSQLPSAHIVSIFAAGKESALFPSDLSLRSPAHYSASNSRSHVVHMTTLFFEKLAEKHRGRLALINVFPGLVITEGFADKRLPAWFRLMWFLATPLTPLFSIKGREVGDRVLFLATELFPARRAVVDDVGKGRGVSSAAEGEARVAIGTDGNRGSGAYSVNWDGESIHVDNKYQKLREEGFAEKVWEHTIRAFEDIEAGRTFTD